MPETELPIVFAPAYKRRTRSRGIVRPTKGGICARSVARAGARCLEASGGVTLQTVRAIAQTGVNVISVGALTHSARARDVALDAN